MTGPAGLARARAAAAPALRPLRAPLSAFARGRRRARYFRDGIEGIAAELRGSANEHAAILREFGAHVGRDCSIVGPLHIVNGERDFARLWIGDRVHLGAGVLLDLADAVRIEDEATLSMGATIVTHIDVGPGPLRERRPRETGPVRVAAGAYLGANATLLHGVTVGERATVGAMALVSRDVPADTTVVAARAVQLPS